MTIPKDLRETVANNLPTFADCYKRCFEVTLPTRSQLLDAADRIITAAQLDWQPIETAPKDGTRVLLFIPEYARKVWIGSYDVYETLHHGVRAYCSEGWQTDGGSFALKSPEPTKWMPLPKADAP